MQEAQTKVLMDSETMSLEEFREYCCGRECVVTTTIDEEHQIQRVLEKGSLDKCVSYVREHKEELPNYAISTTEDFANNVESMCH